MPQKMRAAACTVGLALFAFGTAATLSTNAYASSHPVETSRVLDTRGPVGGHNGRLAAAETLALRVAGVGGVPQNASAVAINVTATASLGAGFVTVWPCSSQQPPTSNVNFDAGQSVPNLVTVGLAGNGTVCLRSSISTHVIVDVSSWFDSGGPFVPLEPTRVVDTRSGLGTAVTKVTPGQPINVPIKGRVGVRNDIVAVALNLTATNADATGYLTAYPCDQPVPRTSNLNVDTGGTAASAVIVTVSATGSVCVASSVPTNVIVDLMGWFGVDAAPVTPQRLLDTRSGIGTAARPMGGIDRDLAVRLGGQSGLPTTGGLAVVNLTVTSPTDDGWLAAYQCDRPFGGTSNVNFRRGQTVANLAIVPVANDGTICLRVSTGTSATVDVIADVSGWLPADTLTPVAPTRFGTLPIGAVLPTDAQCAARVRPTPENKRINAIPNRQPGSAKTLPGRQPVFARVSGNFTGTTDEILQWAACKWGIDEDIVRAQVATESSWRMTQLGDFTSDSRFCAPGHPIGVDGTPGRCPETLGLMQIKWRYNKDAYPEAINSSAYNVDFGLAAWRNCFEGNANDDNPAYRSNDLWGCVGAWYSGNWHDFDAEEYIGWVRYALATRAFEAPSFQEP
jgi:hypothetical protein